MVSTLQIGIGIRCSTMPQRLVLRHVASAASVASEVHGSTLADTARQLRLPMLAACHSGRKPTRISEKFVNRTKIVDAKADSDYQKLLRSFQGGSHEESSTTGENALRNSSILLPEVGDWSDVRKQAETVAAWPLNAFSSQEKLAVANAFVSQATQVLGGRNNDCGGRTCNFYDQLCHSSAAIGVRSDAAVHSGVVVAADVQSLEAASREVVALILSGHAVSLATKRGEALEKAREMLDGFPPELLQAVEVGPTILLPALVRTFRSVGNDADELWAEKVPPADFGNFGSFGSHGMAAAASSFMLAQINSERLEEQSRLRFQLTSDIEDLVAFLGKHKDSRSRPAPSDVYNRGVGDVQHLLELLHALHGTVTVENVANPSVSLVASHKHFVIMGSSTVPEDLVQAAIVSALSPLHEKVTMHAVGLGQKGLLRDPMLSFCRIVQSGKPGLQWRVKEHKDWSAFLDWLQYGTADEVEPPQLFSTHRHFESEVRRSCAEIGGVAWSGLFVREPFEQLRRWTSIKEEDA